MSMSMSMSMSAPAISSCFKANLTANFPSRTQHPLLCYPNPSFFSNNYNLICLAFSHSNSSSSGSNGGEKPLHYGPQEEARWLREEQRWLREEQRWLREESRWNEEREALLREIQRLKSQKQEPERMNFVQESLIPELTANNISKVLQLLKDGELAKSMNRIPESGSSAQPIVLKTTIEEKEDMILKEIIEVPQQMEQKVKKRATLRIGSEGEEVKSMQEALEKLGFYSGEEDMEFSSFSSGTERAVKTWQSTLGAPEDGIMTSELLELLYEEKLGSPSFPAQKTANGAATGSVTDASKVGKTVLTTGTKTEVKIAEHRDEHRVYLIGENRWEDPSKLSGRKNSPGSNVSSGQASSPVCLSCRGEGRMLCMECEGTGEPNIEPQFVEWIGEGAQCAYCDGLGYVTCDVCM